MTDQHLQVPESSKGDTAHAIVKAALGSVPDVGSAAAELFQMVIQPPLEKRRLAWMTQVGERLEALEAKGEIDLEALQHDEKFVSAVMHASSVALKNHQKAKLDALRNAVANVARGQSPEDAVLHMYLQWIDDLSELQIQMLTVFETPQAPPGMHMGGLNSVLEHNIPSLRGKETLYRQLWKDLEARGLFNSSLSGIMSQSGLSEKRTTNAADGFLKFISP